MEGLLLPCNQLLKVKISITLKILTYSLRSVRKYLIIMLLEKKKYIRGNNKPFMTKALSKAIMQRTHFRNKFLKNPTTENRLIYNWQRNFCLSLLRKEKKEYFANLNEKDITDNRTFGALSNLSSQIK